jgi:hypothetical protein
MNNPTIRKKTFDYLTTRICADTRKSIYDITDNFIREDSVWYICNDLVEGRVRDCIGVSVKRSVVTTCIKELLNQK